MRLLLDEQYSPEIAEQLRHRGYDVVAVKGSRELEGMEDEALLRSAAEQGRALLTNNVSDFAPLSPEWVSRGEHHMGLVFTSDESMPRSRKTIGLYIEKLSELLDANPEEDALRGRAAWLG